MTRSPAAKRNLHALWLCAAALLVAVVLTFLPALEFSTVVFTKQFGQYLCGRRALPGGPRRSRSRRRGV